MRERDADRPIIATLASERKGLNLILYSAGPTFLQRGDPRGESGHNKQNQSGTWG